MPETAMCMCVYVQIKLTIQQHRHTAVKVHGRTTLLNYPQLSVHSCSYCTGVSLHH